MTSSCSAREPVDFHGSACCEAAATRNILKPHLGSLRWPKPARQSPALKPVDSLVVDVITDDVSDAYVSKTLFAVSEFTNVVLAGAKVISGELTPPAAG